MFRRPVAHKRVLPGRDQLFRRPGRACLACYDTGVITNSDGLVNELLPDYDRDPGGGRSIGGDLPLICHCAAAHNPPGHGLRGPDGLMAQGLASELSREQVATLHQRRLASWQETERLMRDARQARAAGDPDAVPWFVAEVRHAVAQQLARHGAAAGSGQEPQGAPRRLQPLGGVIAGTLAADQPPARSAAHLRPVVAGERRRDPSGPPPDTAA